MLDTNPNWQMMVSQLLEAGFTQNDLRLKTGIPQSTISDIKQGKPKRRLPFTSGAKLINLYQQTTSPKDTP